jgi:intein/homing endonuclease
MRQTITKTEKNIMFLNKIIVEGFYKGFIENDKFELMRNNFPNNHRIMGNLNENGSYVLKFDYKSPMNFLAKLLFGLGILVSIISPPQTPIPQTPKTPTITITKISPKHP